MKKMKASLWANRLTRVKNAASVYCAVMFFMAVFVAPSVAQDESADPYYRLGQSLGLPLCVIILVLIGYGIRKLLKK